MKQELCLQQICTQIFIANLLIARKRSLKITALSEEKNRYPHG